MKTRTNQPVYKDNGEELKDSDLSGGTKLYRHSLKIIVTDENEYTINFVDNVSTQYTSTSSINSDNCVSLLLSSNDIDASELVPFKMYLEEGLLSLFVYNIDQETYITISTTVNSVVDTITPL